MHEVYTVKLGTVFNVCSCVVHYTVFTYNLLHESTYILEMQVRK
jgi:hypothetical protein